MSTTDPGHYQTDQSNDYRMTPPPPCRGCGGRHGSVGRHLQCLEHALDHARRNPPVDPEYQAWLRTRAENLRDQPNGWVAKLNRQQSGQS